MDPYIVAALYAAAACLVLVPGGFAVFKTQYHFLDLCWLDLLAVQPR